MFLLLGAELIQFFPRHLRRDAASQPPNHEEHANVAQIHGPVAGTAGEDRNDRDPEVSAARVVKTLRHDADDRARAVHLDPASHHRRISPETRRPDRVAQDGHRRGIRKIVVRRERPAERRRSAECLEERCRYTGSRNARRLAAFQDTRPGG